MKKIKLSSLDAAHLKRWFGDAEVVEATVELRIQPNDEDVRTAVRGDPANCVFSRSCQRMWGSRAVLFFGTVAYVDLLDADGKRHVERFMIPSGAEKELGGWDEGKTFTPKGFVLLPPSPSNTLQGKTERRKALLNGESTGQKGSNAKRPRKPYTTARLTTFRSGSGMVHFPARKSGRGQAL